MASASLYFFCEAVNVKQSSFDLLIFLYHILNASGIYKPQNISKTITVLAKTPLLTLKLMMC